MTISGQVVHALDEKTQIIAEALWRTGKIKVASRKALATYIGVDYEALKAAWYKGRISLEMERKLSEAGAFDCGEVAWVDPALTPVEREKTSAQYKGEDTPERFRRMLFKAHGLSSRSARKIEGHQPYNRDMNLAFFSVDGTEQETTDGQGLQIFLNLVISSGLHPSGLEYGFKHLKLRVFFNSDSKCRLNRRIGDKDGASLGDARVRVNGNAHMSEWTLETTGNILRGEYFTSDPLCEVTSGDLGEIFYAELSANILDGSAICRDGKPLPRDAKTSILELLCRKKIPGAHDSHGRVSLSTQKLEIVKVERYENR